MLPQVQQKVKMMEIPPLKIGNKYLIPDDVGEEVEGVLESATVLVSEKSAYGVYLLEDGRRIIVTCPMTDQEMRDYEADPDNYFGAFQPVGKKLTNYEEAYEFCYSVYSNTPKDKLLEFMDNLPNERLAELGKLSQEELAKIYCEGFALSTMKDQKDKMI